MKNNHGKWLTRSEYCRRAFYALSRHFPSTFWIPKKNENYRGVHDALRRCTFIHYLHILIVPFQYLLWTLLVPKVATGYISIQEARLKCFLLFTGQLLHTSNNNIPKTTKTNYSFISEHTETTSSPHQNTHYICHSLAWNHKHNSIFNQTATTIFFLLITYIYLMTYLSYWIYISYNLIYIT